jgi:hypothetical protein
MLCMFGCTSWGIWCYQHQKNVVFFVYYPSNCYTWLLLLQYNKSKEYLAAKTSSFKCEKCRHSKDSGLDALWRKFGRLCVCCCFDRIHRCVSGFLDAVGFRFLMHFQNYYKVTKGYLRILTQKVLSLLCFAILLPFRSLPMNRGTYISPLPVPKVSSTFLFDRWSDCDNCMLHSLTSITKNSFGPFVSVRTLI